MVDVPGVGAGHVVEDAAAFEHEGVEFLADGALAAESEAVVADALEPLGDLPDKADRNGKEGDGKGCHLEENGGRLGAPLEEAVCGGKPEQAVEHEEDEVERDVVVEGVESAAEGLAWGAEEFVLDRGLLGDRGQMPQRATPAMTRMAGVRRMRVPIIWDFMGGLHAGVGGGRSRWFEGVTGDFPQVLAAQWLLPSHNTGF